MRRHPARRLRPAADRDRARAAPAGRRRRRQGLLPGEGALTALGWIAVGLLGGIAAAARFVIDAELTVRLPSPFPLGILAVNLAGALVLGLVAGAGLHGEAYTIVAGGAIGSFTTFSTWILDSHRLAGAGRAELAWLDIAVSLLAGFAMVALGHWLGGVL
ncbi:MAG: fluoride efflux transporter CrcB [Solirubrobacterales bacterium]